MVGQEPADPDEPDEDALAEEVKEFELELEEQDSYGIQDGTRTSRTKATALATFHYLY